LWGSGVVGTVLNLLTTDLPLSVGFCAVFKK
jgi:hypothetical protein